MDTITVELWRIIRNDPTVAAAFAASFLTLSGFAWYFVKLLMFWLEAKAAHKYVRSLITNAINEVYLSKTRGWKEAQNGVLTPEQSEEARKLVNDIVKSQVSPDMKLLVQRHISDLDLYVNAHLELAYAEYKLNLSAKK